MSPAHALEQGREPGVTPEVVEAVQLRGHINAAGSSPSGWFGGFAAMLAE